MATLNLKVDWSPILGSFGKSILESVLQWSKNMTSNWSKSYPKKFVTYLNVSAWLPPVSAVLDGFVLESKLNVLGLSECGDAVVEFAIQVLESDSCVGIVVAVLVVELELFGWPLPHNERVVAALFGWLTCPSAMAIGLGDESGDEVSDDTWWWITDMKDIMQRERTNRTHLPVEFEFLALFAYLNTVPGNLIVIKRGHYLVHPFDHEVPVLRVVVVSLFAIFSLDPFCTLVQTCFYRHASGQLAQLEFEDRKKKLINCHLKMFLQCNLIQHKTRFSNLFSLQRHSLTHYITSFLSHVVTDIIVYYHSYQHNTHSITLKTSCILLRKKCNRKKSIIELYRVALEMHVRVSLSMQVYRLVLDSYLCTFCCCCVWEKREGKLFHVISMLLLLFYYIVLHYTIKTHTTWLRVSFEHYRITAHETWWSTDFFFTFYALHTHDFNALCHHSCILSVCRRV